jgi:hypothetical protein
VWSVCSYRILIGNYAWLTPKLLVCGEYARYRVLGQERISRMNFAMSMFGLRENSKVVESNGDCGGLVSRKMKLLVM